MITLTSNKKSDLQGVSDSHALTRSRLLRENGNFITPNGFKMRKHFFNDKEVGYFKVQKRENAIKNPISGMSVAFLYAF
ncbi:unnamed protein product [Dibothriocephalus latus]|uniref:Uncharacterized protein n=1 Tax=Dibothriocephalus latus TaxID=60516 RepID=A0A3P7LXZ7_DIBLA|nr:unnamed protein product [Dibothriocephalus latus]